jgi:hypothetical protein
LQIDVGERLSDSAGVVLSGAGEGAMIKRKMMPPAPPTQSSNPCRFLTLERGTRALKLNDALTAGEECFNRFESHI